MSSFLQDWLQRKHFKFAIIYTWCKRHVCDKFSCDTNTLQACKSEVNLVFGLSWTQASWVCKLGLRNTARDHCHFWPNIHTYAIKTFPRVQIWQTHLNLEFVLRFAINFQKQKSNIFNPKKFPLRFLLLYSGLVLAGTKQLKWCKLTL